MAASPLTGAEICAIIEACGKSGATFFQCGALSIEFLAGGLGGNQFAGVDHSFGGETPGDGEAGGETRVLLTPEDREVQEEIRLSQLMTDDPVAYEQEMIDATFNQRVPTDGQGN